VGFDGALHRLDKIDVGKFIFPSFTICPAEIAKALM
jgi:hypothetical protein